MGKVLFIKIHYTLNWNNVSKSHVHQDSWHYDSVVAELSLTTESCKDYRGRVGLYFHWDAFNIEEENNQCKFW